MAIPGPSPSKLTTQRFRLAVCMTSLCLCRLAGCQLLHNGEDDEENDDGGDDAEDEDDTRVLAGPVLALTLHELVEDLIAPGDEGVVESCHCECCSS
jgi:hypothetical protein